MSRITVVLHRPIYPRNVGMCARAMANMGVEDLVVIGAPFDMSHEEAKQGAAHAQEILRAARIYTTQNEMLAQEGDGIRIALSGKDGRLKRPEYLDAVLEKMVCDPEHPINQTAQKDIPIFLFFGPEDDGLSIEEMELANHVCRLPTWSEITSLNVSHAVLLTLYMVRTQLLKLPPTDLIKRDPMKKAPVFYPSETIKKWLQALGFDLSARRVNIEKTLNRILLSRSPTQDELRIVDTVLQQTVRQLKGEKNSQN